MGFRKLRGVSMPYAKQGQIYFTCLNYRTAPVYTKMKIEKLCDKVGEEYSTALFELLTTGQTVPAVAIKHNISDITLARARRKFYMSW